MGGGSYGACPLDGGRRRGGEREGVCVRASERLRAYVQGVGEEGRCSETMNRQIRDYIASKCSEKPHD